MPSYIGFNNIKHPVVCQSWIEHERGCGQRPDGYSLHLTKDDCDKFIKDYWKKQPNKMGGRAPDCYSSPDGSPTIVDVNDSTHAEIVNSKNGIFVWKLFNT